MNLKKNSENLAVYWSKIYNCVQKISNESDKIPLCVDPGPYDQLKNVFFGHV